MSPRLILRNAFLVAVLLVCFAVPVEAAPSGLVLDPAIWTLVVDHDFAKGDAPGLYNAFCGAQGGGNGKNVNNFSKQNVYWENGALTLRFEKRTNTSCPSHGGMRATRDYAGAGFSVKAPTPSPTSIAAEFEILGTDVYGVSPYATLWPSNEVKPSCGWGAEDDFFEQDARTAGRELQTYHYWSQSPACTHLHHQIFQTIPDIATSYHTYSVIRDGGTQFYYDGIPQTLHDGQATAVDFFQNHPMTVQMGIGAENTAMPDDSRLPAYVRIRHIKVWYKKTAGPLTPANDKN